VAVWRRVVVRNEWLRNLLAENFSLLEKRAILPPKAVCVVSDLEGPGLPCGDGEILSYEVYCRGENRGGGNGRVCE
jgi:hypothetical protein